MNQRSNASGIPGPFAALAFTRQFSRRGEVLKLREADHIAVTKTHATRSRTMVEANVSQLNGTPNRVRNMVKVTAVTYKKKPWGIQTNRWHCPTASDWQKRLAFGEACQKLLLAEGVHARVRARAGAASEGGAGSDSQGRPAR